MELSLSLSLSLSLGLHFPFHFCLVCGVQLTDQAALGLQCDVRQACQQSCEEKGRGGGAEVTGGRARRDLVKAEKPAHSHFTHFFSESHASLISCDLQFSPCLAPVLALACSMLTC